jgi:hypothetical protein
MDLNDGTYTISDGDCIYADNDIFHSDVFNSEEQGYITSGTVIVSENVTVFEISGLFIKIDENNNDIPLGPVIGRFVFE